MGKLPLKTRAPIIRCLVDGMSIRATARTADGSKNTFAKLLVDVGKVCGDYQDRALRNLPCNRMQVDQIWSFVHARQENVAAVKAAPQDAACCGPQRRPCN